MYCTDCMQAQVKQEIKALGVSALCAKSAHLFASSPHSLHLLPPFSTPTLQRHCQRGAWGEQDHPCCLNGHPMATAGLWETVGSFTGCHSVPVKAAVGDAGLCSVLFQMTDCSCLWEEQLPVSLEANSCLQSWVEAARLTCKQNKVCFMLQSDHSWASSRELFNYKKSTVWRATCKSFHLSSANHQNCTDSSELLSCAATINCKIE